MSGFEISPSHVGTLSILTLIHTYHQSLSTLIRLSEVRHLPQVCDCHVIDMHSARQYQVPTAAIATRFTFVSCRKCSKWK